MSNSEKDNTAIFNNAKNDFFFDLSNGDIQGDFKFINTLSYLKNGSTMIGDVVVVLPKAMKTQDQDCSLLGCKGLTIVREDPIAAFAESIMSAKINSRGLFVVRELIDIDLGALLQMVEIEAEDPYIGSIQPRFSDARTDDIYLLPANLRYENALFCKAALRFLPRKILNSDFISPILFLTKSAVRMGDVRQYDDFEDVLLDFIVGIRRQGFRNLVNSNVIHPISTPDGYVYKNWSSNLLLDKELNQSREFSNGNPENSLEKILKYAIENQSEIQYKILLDCRGISSHVNGTSEAVLGYLEGISAADIDCLEVTVLVHDEPNKFHNISRRFANFKIITELSSESFVLSLVLGQLWSMDILKELHSRSVFLSCVMFDTISWDIIYPTTSKRNSFWRVMPNLIDTIFFISSFSKNRFYYRFPALNPCRNIVSYLTVDKRFEINLTEARKFNSEKYIFIMGNSLDHKRVDLTVELILNSFPKLKIVKIGGDIFNSDSVINLDSGNIPEEELIDYIRCAELVIYPSCYEGFGLPVIESLALGKPTLVQESELWDEVSNLVAGDTNLIQYDTYLDLIEKAGRILSVAKVRAAPSQESLTSKLLLKSHEESVKSMLDECMELIYLGNCDRWIYRQNIINSFR